MSSSPPHWNQLPAEVLGIILSNLQRKNDLLRSRLVCHSWNAECLIVLKKLGSEFHQRLTENINQYFDFVHNGDGVPEVCTLIPYHLDINLNAAKTKLNKFTENVEVLWSTFGKECITKITLSTPNAAFEPEYRFVRFWLIELLVKISSGLKILSLSDFNLNFGIYTDNEIEGTDLWDVKFPKLKSLTCSENKFSSRDYELIRKVGHVKRHPMHQYIIERSPHLENLKQISTDDLIGLPINYDKLKTLTIGKTITHPSKILNKFRLSSNSPTLQNLGFSMFHFVDVNQMAKFQNLLELFSATLKSLTITTTGEYLSVNKIGTRRSGLMTFPMLPNLQHLRLNIDTQANNNNRVNATPTIEDPICYDPEEKNFSPEFLPSLKHVDVPLGFFLRGKSGRKSSVKEEVDPPIKFPGVNELTIRISTTRLSVRMSDLGEPLKHLQKVFPNILKFSIVNESIECNGGQGLKLLFQHIIQSPLSKNAREINFLRFENNIWLKS